MSLGLLVASENANKVLFNIQWIFNTGPYGDPPLKIKISKIGLRSDLSWPKLGLAWSQNFMSLGLLVALEIANTHTDIQTRFMFYKYRLLYYLLALDWGGKKYKTIFNQYLSNIRKFRFYLKKII